MMNVKLVDFDNEHYVASVTHTEGTLQWRSAGNTHQIIIRGEFGADINFGDKEKTVLEQYTKEQFEAERETNYADELHLTIVKKGTFVDSYNVTVTPATYAVIGCSYEPETNTITVYIPTQDCLYQCKVFSQVSVRITQEPIKKKFLGIFGKDEKPYYTIHIPPIPGYVDGSLKYTFDGCKYEYPITKAMLGQNVSVPAYNGKAPKINVSEKNGYKII